MTIGQKEIVANVGEVVLSNKKIYHIGIQAPEGTQFKINDSSQTVKIGNTGIWEVNLQNSDFYITTVTVSSLPPENINVKLLLDWEEV